MLTFRPTSTSLDHALVVCNLTQILGQVADNLNQCVIKARRSGSKHHHSLQNFSPKYIYFNIVYLLSQHFFLHQKSPTTYRLIYALGACPCLCLTTDRRNLRRPTSYSAVWRERWWGLSFQSSSWSESTWSNQIHSHYHVWIHGAAYATVLILDVHSLVVASRPRQVRNGVKSNKL